MAPKKIPLNFAGRSLQSFATFNAGWWLCALGPRYDWPWAGPALMPVWIALHIYFSPTRLGELLFLAQLAVLGFAIDTALIQIGIFSITPATGMAPPWLVSMWVLLGLTFEGMLMIRRSLFLVCLMGVMSGPLSYLFAQAVNILAYTEPSGITMGIHAVLWATLMPFLFILRDYSVSWTVSRNRARTASGPMANRSEAQRGPDPER